MRAFASFSMVAVALSAGCGSASDEGFAQPFETDYDSLRGAGAARHSLAVDDGASLVPPLDEQAVGSDSLLPAEDFAALAPVAPAPEFLDEVDAEGRVGKAFGPFTRFRAEAPSAVVSQMVVMQPANTHVCVLGLVWGTLYQPGSISVIKVNTGTWNLTANMASGTGTSPLAVGDGICYPLSAFQATGTARWVSGTLGPLLVGPGTLTQLAWFGNAATYLSHVGGRFHGSGERAKVFQNNVPDLASQIQITSQHSGNHIARGYSLFVGQPGAGHVSQFIGPDGVGTSAQAGEFFAKNQHPGCSSSWWGSCPFHSVTRVRMAHSTEAMCYMTELTGKFNGGNEWAFIFADSEGFWNLETNSFAGGWVQARARCYRLRQFAGE